LTSITKRTGPDTSTASIRLLLTGAEVAFGEKRDEGKGKRDSHGEGGPAEKIDPGRRTSVNASGLGVAASRRALVSHQFSRETVMPA